MGELSAQYSNWEYFRCYQEKIRRYHLQRQTFHVYLKEMRNRLRRHRLQEHITLHPDRQQQSGLENWIEFQNYHFAIHETIEKDIKNGREELNDARNQSEDTGASGRRDVRDIEIFEYRLKYDERLLKQHENLLRWIEQQRITMFVKQTTVVYDNGSHGDNKHQNREAEPRLIRTSSAPNRRKDQKTDSALRPVRSGVSKKKPQKRILPPQSRDVSAATKNKLIASSTDIQEKNHRRVKKSTPLRPFRPQRVSKIAKNTRAKSNPASVNATARPPSQSKRRKPRKQLASVNIKCSGRVSRRPEKFCPG